MQKFLWILLSIQFSVSAFECDSILENIPNGERFYLNQFFKACVREDHFGYTIFFDKPISASGFLIKCPNKEIPSPYLNKLISVGWSVLKKHEPLFTHQNYIFCEETEEIYSAELKSKIKICHIYLVNKTALLRLLKEKSLLFTEQLGYEFSPEKFLDQIEKNKTLTPHLNNNEALLGIVLGYGSQSSLKFAEMRAIDKLPSKDGSCQPISSYRPNGCKINPVVFIGNVNSSEDLAIQQHYSAQIDEIWTIYKSKDFLVQVINKLCTTTFY